jgi:hypothetical protein
MLKAGPYIGVFQLWSEFLFLCESTCCMDQARASYQIKIKKCDGLNFATTVTAISSTIHFTILSATHRLGVPSRLLPVNNKWLIYIQFGENSSSHGDEYEDGYLLGCCAVQSGRY